MEGAINLLPKPTTSDIPRQTPPTELLPQRSSRKTPQPTPLSPQGPSTPIAVSLQKRRPGRPSKQSLIPGVNNTGIVVSVSTQSDGEGTVTKKRRVALEADDQAQNIPEGITSTESFKPKKSRRKLDQDHESQHNDQDLVSTAKLSRGRKKRSFLKQTLEKKIGLAQGDDHSEGENQGSSGITKISSPLNQVSQVPDNQIVGSHTGQALISGQQLKIDSSHELPKLALLLCLRNGEESTVTPPLELNGRSRPTRKKRKFIGDVQRFASEAPNSSEPGNLAARTGTAYDGERQNDSTSKKLHKRGRPRKNLSTIGQPNEVEGKLQNKKPRKNKSATQSSHIEGRLEKPAPKRRGRPKRVISLLEEDGGMEAISEGVRISEIDLEVQPSQIKTPAEHSPPGIEAQRKTSLPFRGEIIDLQENFPGERRGESEEFGAQIENPLVNLENHGKSQAISLPRGDFSDSSGISCSAGPNQQELGAHSPLLPGTEGQPQQPLPLLSDVSDLPCISYSTRPDQSELGVQQHMAENPRGKPPPPSERHPKKFLLPVGKETDPKGTTRPSQIALGKQLPLLERQSIKLPSRGNGVLSTVEGGDMEGHFLRTNKKPRTQLFPVEVSSNIKLSHSRVRPRKLLKPLENSQQPIGPLSQEGPSLPVQPPGKKKGRPKKQILDPEISSEIKETAFRPFQGTRDVALSKEDRPSAYTKPSKNPIVINVYRVSSITELDEKGVNTSAAADSVVSFQDRRPDAVDVLAQVCHEFALKSEGSLDHILKRKLEIIEECGNNFDRRLFQLVSSPEMMSGESGSNHRVCTYRKYGTIQLHFQPKPRRPKETRRFSKQNREFISRK